RRRRPRARVHAARRAAPRDARGRRARRVLRAPPEPPLARARRARRGGGVTPLPGPRFSTSRGIPVFVEPSHELPLVDVEILFREGAVLDPPGGDGLTRLTAQMLRRGPRGTSAEAFDEAIEALGATLGASVGSHAVRFSGAVIRRNLEPFLALLGRMLSDPGLRAKDLARQKRKNEAELIELRDHD